jgi:hypothetical protein
MGGSRSPANRGAKVQRQHPLLEAAAADRTFNARVFVQEKVEKQLLGDCSLKIRARSEEFINDIE